MSPNSTSGGDDSSSGGSGGGGGPALKKGPWTAAEDAILMEYVKKHGEGNWNAVQKNSGLSRCGKSCRLRWANHLRPNLKKGSFSAEEERLILELHSKLGNKWARMAAQLPGRTDNEIKNYWNTRIKRRQRQGLPLYPPDIQRQATYHHHRQHPSQPLAIPSLHQKNQFSSPGIPLLDPMNFSTVPMPLLTTTTQNPHQSLFPPALSIHNRFKRLRENTFMGSSDFSLSYSSSSLPLFQHNLQNQHQHHPFGLGDFEPNGLATSMKMELPSNQLAEPATASNSNSGLLDALLQEAQVLSGDLGKEGLLGEAVDGKCCWAGDSFPTGQVLFSESGIATPQLGSTSAHSPSIGIEAKKEPTEENDSVDRDLSALFDIIPASMPMVSEWYNDNGEMSNAQSSASDDNIGLEMQHLTSSLTVSSEQDWSLGSCTWNNMPGIC
ncbi:hypothetical protein AAC387_Pa06g2061 [Persea americana]